MMEELDALIRRNWDNDVVRSDDPRRLAVKSIDLPHPWVAGAAPTSPDWYTTMFSWDTSFSTSRSWCTTGSTWCAATSRTTSS